MVARAPREGRGSGRRIRSWERRGTIDLPKKKPRRTLRRSNLIRVKIRRAKSKSKYTLVGGRGWFNRAAIIDDGFTTCLLVISKLEG